MNLKDKLIYNIFLNGLKKKKLMYTFAQYAFLPDNRILIFEVSFWHLNTGNILNLMF